MQWSCTSEAHESELARVVPSFHRYVPQSPLHVRIGQPDDTFGKSLDYSSAFFGYTGERAGLADSNNMRADHGPSSFDLRHRAAYPEATDDFRNADVVGLAPRAGREPAPGLILAHSPFRSSRPPLGGLFVS